MLIAIAPTLPTPHQLNSGGHTNNLQKTRAICTGIYVSAHSVSPPYSGVVVR
jgi:hypothetical protein